VKIIAKTITSKRHGESNALDNIIGKKIQFPNEIIPPLPKEKEFFL